jgi:hypothetical protein
LKRYLENKNDQTVIFLHIPKSGGMTLYDILNREYERKYIYTFSGGRHRLQGDIDKFKALSSEERNSFRLLRGHIPFGIHGLLHKPFTYVTMLREPIARVVSHYYYVLNNPNHLLHEKVVSVKMSLETYVSSGINYELDNGQTRQLAGVTEDIPFGACTDDLLVKAKENVDCFFSIVGLTEQFDETLMLMKQSLGWKTHPVYIRKNVLRNKKNKSPLSEEMRQLITSYNQLDLELYAYATQIFIRKLSLLSGDELEEFNKLNRLYFLYGKLLTLSRKNLRRIRQVFPK